MSQAPKSQREAAKEYFQMLAEIGVTKHLGSLDATHEILDKAQIDDESLVLDVGCGIGLTPAYLVRRYGARVIGIDLTYRMLERARQEARDRHVEDRVAYCVADAQALPFADGAFDTVMAESVYVFVPDRSRALNEAVRVVEAGGRVGVTESTWLVEPDGEAEAFMASIGGKPLEEQDWVALMEGAGLEDIASTISRVDVRAEARGRLERFGCRSLLRILVQFIPALMRSRESRRVIDRALGSAPGKIAREMGYGVYTGRKPDDGGFAIDD
ncbi:MAG: class I SAM-dependent methyltransferase [Anaerolineae bacterium]